MEIPAEEQILHASAYEMNDAGLDYSSRIDLVEHIDGNHLTWDSPGSNWKIMVVVAQPHDLDYLNPVVANSWMDLLMGEYERRMPDQMGTIIQAYGPDEMTMLQGNILFSPKLLERFHTEKGYDPLPFLSGMFHDIGSFTDKIRCDYFDVMISLLDENFYKPIADWVHNRGLLYTTIATWGREDPTGQTYHYGDFFKMMRHFNVTGNEDPEAKEMKRRAFIDAKFSSSIAHIYGGERVAVCGYWGSGWGVTQEENLLWTYANYAYGINFYNRHGGVYTLLGGWYEWVPPSVHFYQPYWQYWRHFTDHVRRMSHIMSQGTHVADVAILYPLTTMHAGWTGGHNFADTAQEASLRTVDLARSIYYNGIDFEFIDDNSLVQAQCGDGILRIADIDLQAVVLPSLATIRRDTLEMLHRFVESGGVVVAFGRLPDASPEAGRKDPVIRATILEMFGAEAGAAPSNIMQNENPGGGRAIFVPGDTEDVATQMMNVINRDFIASQPDVFHTHQRTGNLDIYLIVNVKPEPRRISVDLRTTGYPEIWNTFTGEVQSVYRFERRGDRTVVELDMDIYEGVVLVVDPDRDSTRIIADDLDAIKQITCENQVAEVDGVCETGGTKTIRFLCSGTEYNAEIDVENPPDPILLDSTWDVRFEPTMDNTWGDFRYPPAKTKIGSEARTFQYREETDKPGADLGWHEPPFDDADWERVTCGYGPYWWTLGPFGVDHEPNQALHDTIAGDFDPNLSINAAGRTIGWEPLVFSLKHGADFPERSWGGLEGVRDEFLTCPEVAGENDAVRYLFTYINVSEKTDWHFDLGRQLVEYHEVVGAVSFARDAWINGEQIISATVNDPLVPVPVTLHRGLNAVLLRIVQPKGATVSVHAAFVDPDAVPEFDPYVPLLRWFREPPVLAQEVTPDEKRVGWFRFTAPPGLTSMRTKVFAEHIQAWIDGNQVLNQAVECSPEQKESTEIEVSLESPINQCSQIAFRVEMAPTCYAGAVFDEYVSFACETGQIEIGDWCKQGMECYSGGAIYSTLVTLETIDSDMRIILDLGNVGIVAEVFINGESAGVRMARPYRFDVTDLMKPGANTLEVKVVNTLANHMTSYPTERIHTGQTVSGLLGPVEIRFSRLVRASVDPAT